MISEDELERSIDIFYNTKEHNISFLKSRCITELRRLTAYSGEYYDAIDDVISTHTEVEEDKYRTEIEAQMEHAIKVIKSNYSIRPGTWLEAEEMHTCDFEDIDEWIEAWCEGLLGQERSYELYWELDEGIDTDVLLVLFGIPNGRVTGAQRDRLVEAVVQIGSRNTDEEPLSGDVLIKRVLERKYGPKN